MHQTLTTNNAETYGWSNVKQIGDAELSRFNVFWLS